MKSQIKQRIEQLRHGERQDGLGPRRHNHAVGPRDVERRYCERILRHDHHAARLPVELQDHHGQRRNARDAHQHEALILDQIRMAPYGAIFLFTCHINFFLVLSSRSA